MRYQAVARPTSILSATLTSVGTVATAVCTTAHGLDTGMSVTVAGATPAGYNGVVVVTVTDATHFTYTVVSGLTTPATGTITATPTFVYPVTKAQMEAHLKRTIEDEAYFNTIQKAIIKFFTKMTNVDVVTTRYEGLETEFFETFVLAKNPIQSINKIEYLKSSVWTTIATTVYYLKQNKWFCDVYLNEDQEWPEDDDDIENNVKITFVSGYADGSIPEDIQMFIMQMYAAIDQNRGDCIPSASPEEYQGF
jgi:hypothetical protein